MTEPTDLPGDAEDQLPEDQLPHDPAPEDSIAAAPRSPWSGWFTGTALALIVIAVVDILAVMAQGLALPARVGPLLRIGFAFGLSFNKDALGWMVLLLAIVLATLPAALGWRTSERDDRTAALVVALATGFAALLALAAVLGVVANVRLYDLSGRELDAGVKRELAMFAFRRIATAAVVIGAGVTAVRMRFPKPGHA